MSRPSVKRLLAFCVLGGLMGCDNLLKVDDPSRFTDEDLDNALLAVAVGVEGDLHAIFDNYIIGTSLLSDVWQHTGTWAGYDDIDHGRFTWERNQNAAGDPLLRARFAAQDALARFERLEAEGATIPTVLRARVMVSEGWADLVMAGAACEVPAGQQTAAISDQALYAQASSKLTAALAYTGGTDFELWARAGIARAELMQGNYGPADAAATAVLAGAPVGWEKLALYQVGTLTNGIVNLNTWGFNHAAGMREKWWPLVDDAALLMRDPLTGELDSRVPIRHEDGVLGVDGTTEYYSQWKYRDQGADIPMADLDEMTLIRAEAAMETGDPAGALAMLNGLRNAVGLSDAPASMFANPAAPTRDEVFDVLLNERFAELFMGGQRLQDLYRFRLTTGFMVGTGPGRAGFPVGVGDFAGTVSPRPIKFPLGENEAINNPNIEDDASLRCLPMSG